jgi:hypothetical protein
LKALAVETAPFGGTKPTSVSLISAQAGVLREFCSRVQSPGQLPNDIFQHLL